MRAIQLALQAKRIIDDDFARKKNHRELLAEGPGLDRVGNLRLQLCAAIEARELNAGVIAFVTPLLRGLGILLARGRLVEWQLDAMKLRRDRFGERREIVSLQDRFNLSGDVF